MSIRPKFGGLTRLARTVALPDDGSMNDQHTPIISRVLSDGTILETIFDPAAGMTALAVGHPDGTLNTVPHYDLPDGTRLIPYSANNNLIASGCVLLPSAIGDVGDFGDVIGDIRTYLSRYVDLSPGFLTLAPYYVLLTWAFDLFNEVPYLRFQGDWGSGKTRALLALGSLCYKPFFASGASTVSPIFHILDAFGGTLILDEADFRFSDATNELTKILNNGTVRGLPVLRTMTNRHKELNPTAFKVFGPKVIAMRESFGDEALESRFLTERMARRQLSPHIPINTPDSLRDEAQVLRNRLLRWRLENHHKIAPDPDARIEGGNARTNQMALPLLSLVTDSEERRKIARWIADGRAPERESAESEVVSAMVDAFAEATVSHVTIADIAARLNAQLGDDMPMTNKWVGGIVRKLGIPTAKSNGVYGISIRERSRVATLAERLCVKRNPPVDNPPPANPVADSPVYREREITVSMEEQP